MSFSFRRVCAIFLRNMMAERRNFMRLMDAVYWPVIDIILWGMTSRWISETKQNLPDFILIIMTGLIFWQVVMRVSYEISVGLLDEVFNKSFVTLFSTPLSLAEWMLGVMLNGIIKTLFVLLFGSTVVWGLYALNIFDFGWMLIPFTMSLIIFGWITGLVGAACIVYWGSKVMSIPWAVAFFFAPLSAVYYPLEALPYWAQAIAVWLPTPYIFEGMRTVITMGIFPTRDFAMSIGLNGLYLAGALLLFKIMFEKSRARGFDRL